MQNPQRGVPPVNMVLTWLLLVFVFISSVLLLVYAILGDGNTSKTKTTRRNNSVIPVGVTPHGLALYKSRLYVANNNNYGITGSDSITVIDTCNNSVLTTIAHPSFQQPYTITVDPIKARAYVTNSNSSTVSVLNLMSNTVIGIIGGFDGPSGLTIPFGCSDNIGYVNNYGGPNGVQSGNGRTVQRVNLDTYELVGEALVVGLAPAAIRSSPNGDFIYTINYTTGLPNTGTMSRIDVKTNRVIVTFVSGLFGPFEFVLDDRGNYAYVTNFGSNNFAPYGNTVAVVDLRTACIVSTIVVGIQPSGIDICKNRYLVVSNYNTLYAGSGFTNLTAGEGTVQIFDITCIHKNNRKQKSKLIRTFRTAQSPSQVLARHGRIYVTNFTGNTVSVFSLC